MSARHPLLPAVSAIALIALGFAAAVAAEERRDFQALSATHTETARLRQAPTHFDEARLRWSGEIDAPMPRRARGAVVCSTRYLANGGGVRRVKAVCDGSLEELDSALKVVRRIELPPRSSRSDRSGHAKVAWSDDELGGFVAAGADYRVTARCSSPTKGARKRADTVRTACSLIYRVPCLADATTLCLGVSRLSGDGRFRIEAKWRTAFDEQLRRAAGFTNGANEGILMFETGAGNQVGELKVRVEDHCRDPESQRFWVRANGNEKLQYFLRVTDTEGGSFREYVVEADRGDQLLLDRYAFSVCP